jgi:hypothetical protein
MAKSAAAPEEALAPATMLEAERLLASAGAPVLK